MLKLCTPHMTRGTISLHCGGMEISGLLNFHSQSNMEALTSFHPLVNLEIMKLKDILLFSTSLGGNMGFYQEDHLEYGQNFQMDSGGWLL